MIALKSALGEKYFYGTGYWQIFFKRAIFHHCHRAKTLNPSELQQADCCEEDVIKEKREKFQNLRNGLRLSMTSGSQGIHFATQHYLVRHASCF
ncbi:hypothetical protein ACTRXD_17395 [Nitrospira sp. T9]|uniref:hypothetical protein n=1 Tax=unclassified Nitrospira TaxID=2652172 RepID=UPI003F982F4E